VALDSGFFIAVAKRDRRIHAFVEEWLSKGAAFIVPAPVLAEVTRGSFSDAPINRMINAVASVVPTTEVAVRDAGASLATIASRPAPTVDALVVATAVANLATTIVTSDPDDIGKLARGALRIVAI
jgi:predicted nucleic acid-binding protein